MMKKTSNFIRIRIEHFDVTFARTYEMKVFCFIYANILALSSLEVWKMLEGINTVWSKMLAEKKNHHSR
jgi:hypothetical protein